MLNRGGISLAALCLLTSCGDGRRDETPANSVHRGPAASPKPVPRYERAPIPLTREGRDAAAALRHYYALIEARHYAEAWALRWKGRGDTQDSAKAFAASFGRYAAFHATLGAPGPMQAVSGSDYVDIPVQLEGRTMEGKPFITAGVMTVRRADGGPWLVYSAE